MKEPNDHVDEVMKEPNDHVDEDLDGWLQTIHCISEKAHETRVTRIATWASTAGEPHAEAQLDDGIRVGFWKLPGGLIRIRASKRGDFDPAEGVIIEDREVLAIIAANGHSAVKSTAT